MLDFLKPKRTPDRIPVGVWIRYSDGSLAFQQLPSPPDFIKTSYLKEAYRNDTGATLAQRGELKS